MTFLNIQSDDNAHFLHAARKGNMELMIKYLKPNMDINVYNAVRILNSYNQHRSKEKYIIINFVMCRYLQISQSFYISK